jgi:hypothetical protein
MEEGGERLRGRMSNKGGLSLFALNKKAPGRIKPGAKRKRILLKREVFTAIMAYSVELKRAAIPPGTAALRAM